MGICTTLIHENKMALGSCTETDPNRYVKMTCEDTPPLIVQKNFVSKLPELCNGNPKGTDFSFTHEHGCVMASNYNYDTGAWTAQSRRAVFSEGSFVQFTYSGTKDCTGTFYQSASATCQMACQTSGWSHSTPGESDHYSQLVDCSGVVEATQMAPEPRMPCTRAQVAKATQSRRGRW